MWKKTNDIKKRPKKGLKIVCSVIACAFALLSVFVPFSGLKSAKADVYLPPGTSGNDSYATAYVSSLHSKNIDFYILDNGQHNYSISTSVPYLYDNGVGVSSYDNFTVYDSYGSNPITGIYSLSTNNIYFALDPDVEIQYTRMAVELSGGIVYCNESLYNSMFFSVGFNIPGIDEVTALYKIELLYPSTELDEGLSLVPYSYSATYNLTGSSNFSGLSWSQLQELGLVQNGYIAVYSYAVSFHGFVTARESMSILLACNNQMLLLNDYDLIQKAGFDAFAPLYGKYVKIPVDDIGLGVIINAVTAFLNTEFVPGFRLWYFLLIGLGCSIVGIALKFFLGG